MKRYTVVVTARARRHLDQLEEFIASEAGDTIARDYVDAILTQCSNLQVFPHRGTLQSHLGMGLRLLVFRRKAKIFFRVRGDEVRIEAVLYSGQDYEAAFRR